MAKQRTDYKNRDNSETTILQYVDVYIRILTAGKGIVPPASRQPRADGATGVRRLTSSRHLNGNSSGLRRSCKSSLA